MFAPPISVLIRSERKSVSPCFWPRRFRSTVPRLTVLRASPECREVDAIGAFLAINDPLLLHVEGDHGEFADMRIAGNLPEDGDQRRVSMGRTCDEREFCGAKFTRTLTLRAAAHWRRVRWAVPPGTARMSERWMELGREWPA